MKVEQANERRTRIADLDNVNVYLEKGWQVLDSYRMTTYVVVREMEAMHSATSQNQSYPQTISLDKTQEVTTAAVERELAKGRELEKEKQALKCEQAAKLKIEESFNRLSNMADDLKKQISDQRTKIAAYDTDLGKLRKELGEGAVRKILG